jgi:hypothetical protein
MFFNSYQCNGDTLTKNGSEIRITKVKDTIENDIQRERWRAASILKQIGELRVKNKSSRKGDIKFIFYSKTDNSIVKKLWS